MSVGHPVLRATISVESSGPAPLIEQDFKVTWQPPGTPQPNVRLQPKQAARLATLVEGLPRGAIDFQGIRDAAPALGCLLGTNGLSPAELFELATNGTATVLTDIPWEAAAIGSEALPDDASALFERLLASLPICRLVPASSTKVVLGECRPRLMLCISNPPGIDGGQILVGPIETACEQALIPYPVFQLKKLRGPLTWPSVSSEIVRFRPNLLIIVGHGSSNPTGGDPTLAFVRVGDKGGVDRVPITRLGETLSLAKSCCLVALFACDLVRTSGHSAACELVRQGIGEILAMQGSVEQQCARAAMVEVLSQLLAGAPLPSAAAAARRATKNHPHAILPAVFRASDRSRNASELAPLSTLYVRALGSLYARVIETHPMFKRDALQKKVQEVLSGTGVAALDGGFGNGSSTVLRAAVAALLSVPLGLKSRPVLYIDCDRRPGYLSLSDWVNDQCTAAISPHPVLRPLSSPDFIGRRRGEELGASAVEAEISIVLDNLPVHASAEDKAFIEALVLAYTRPDCRACLLLAGAGEMPESVRQEAIVGIPSLSVTETERFANELITGTSGQELYKLTGGTLLLLDEERRMRTQSGRSRKMLAGDRGILELYLDRLEEWLPSQALEAAARLALFAYPVDLRIVKEFITPDLPHAVETLLDAGLAMSFDDDTITWLLVPERKAEGIRARKQDDQERIEHTLAEKFLDKYKREDPEEILRRITALPGASEYLKIVQLCLAGAQNVDVALFLPLRAQGTQLHAAGLFQLFQQAVQLLDAAEIEDADILAMVFLPASKAALNIGELGIAKQWFARIPEALDLITECRRLGLKAAILKDEGQATALEEILQCLAQAAELMREVPPGELAEWNDVRRELAFDSLPTALFLNRESADSALKRLESIFPLVSPQEKAQLLATLAEREMKEPDTANWTHVADWVTEAASAVEGGSDDRAVTYCLYQQAQYLRSHLKRYSDAWRTYQESRFAGKRAGEPRREGLALVRLIELERDVSELRERPSDWPSSRLKEVDATVRSLWSAPGDALSMRALGRLQAVSGPLDTDINSRRDRLTQAARAFSAAVLSARTDNRKFAEICLQMLDLELAPSGNFLLMHRFLFSFKSEIKRRLGIPVDLEKPEAARKDISTWLTESALEGGQHG